MKRRMDATLWILLGCATLALEVLIPAATISRWLGSERPGQGIVKPELGGKMIPASPETSTS